jgi:hypothetical protein
MMVTVTNFNLAEFLELVYILSRFGGFVIFKIYLSYDSCR